MPLPEIRYSNAPLTPEPVTLTPLARNLYGAPAEVVPTIIKKELAPEAAMSKTA